MSPTAIGAFAYRPIAPRRRTFPTDRWCSTSARVSRRNAPPVLNETLSVGLTALLATRRLLDVHGLLRRLRGSTERRLGGRGSQLLLSRRHQRLPFNGCEYRAGCEPRAGDA